MNKKKNYILIAVDCQNDFVEGGRLPVKGGKKAIEAIDKLLNLRVNDNNLQVDETGEASTHEHTFIKECIFTVDSHPFPHCSFKCNPDTCKSDTDLVCQGEWPIHCVENTVGAAIVDPLVNSCITNGIPFGCVEKGQDPHIENYSALKFVMKNNDMYSYSMAPYFEPSGTLLEFLRDEDGEYDEIIIAGLAGDICVLETIKAMIDMDPIVYCEGTASIDGGTKLIELISEGHLRMIDSNGKITRAGNEP